MLNAWQQTTLSAPLSTGLFMTIGAFNTGTWGVVYGFNENSRYGTGAPSGKAGDLTTTLFRDTRVIPNRVVRIASISFQQNLYIVLGAEVIDTPITANMPTMTWKLAINNTVYDFSTASAAGFLSPVTGKYIQVVNGSIPWNGLTVGQAVPFSFV